MVENREEVAAKFCELCDWLLQAWQFQKFMFDENPQIDILQVPRHEHFFHRLHVISQEYWLHQLAKLHDPAVQQKGQNLTINYMIEYGEFDEGTRSELVALLDKMNILSKPIKVARNKCLSHNDLSVLLSNEVLGTFSPGDDETYFACLIQFADIVSHKIIGEPFVYDDLVSNDVESFMHCFERGSTS